MAAPGILDEAADELEAAAAYLELERVGYGRLFLDDYEEKLRVRPEHIRAAWERLRDAAGDAEP